MAAEAASFNTVIDTTSLILKGAPGTPSTTYKGDSPLGEPIPRIVIVGSALG